MQFLNSEIPGYKTEFCLLKYYYYYYSKEQLRATTNDIKQTFKNHFRIFGRNLIKNSMRLLALWIYITFDVKGLGNSFINSQFPYCHFIWMLRSEKLNKKDGQNLRKVFQFNGK